MSRSVDLVQVAFATAAALLLTACGTEHRSASDTPSSTAAEQSTRPVVVGGPRITRPATSITDQTSKTTSGTRECGKTAGPDGALRVLILDGTVRCADAKKLASAYSPKIATGQPQTVDGWQCGPSETAGILAACIKGDAEIDFAP
ncbi:MAG: hypothetical protein QM673_06790 [Gordonia sp. (in: high G+C Gram-positive bacteria)]